MASISNDKNGTRRLQYTDLDGERKAIWLGKISKKDAHAVQLRVEELLSCKHCGTSPARTTLQWVASISVKLRTKLVRHRLVEIGDLPTTVKKVSVQNFLATYLEKRSVGKKPATAVVWQQVINSLVTHLPKDIAIQDVTPGHTVDWLDKLRAEKLASTTIHKRISFARQFFGYAVDHKMIRENPFKTISVPRPKTKSNVEVPRATIDKVIGFCDPIWKAIICLSRYGGLRCPSEVLTLKWSEVDFTLGKMIITAPKNEHHDGGGVRECPLFPRVREALEGLVRVDEYVIDKPGYREAANTEKGWANSNLRTQFLKQLDKADVKPWPRLFHSMRASCQTELEKEFGRPAACAWLGNTEVVAKESYLLVFDEDWQRAIGKKPTDGGNTR